MTHEHISFEKSFERLEQILETMNTGKTPLEESLSLFEEAEKLIRTCTTKLTKAEQKIEMLIKDRNGEIALDATQKPKVEPYNTQMAQGQPIATSRTPVPPPKAAVHAMDDLPF